MTGECDLLIPLFVFGLLIACAITQIDATIRKVCNVAFAKGEQKGREEGRVFKCKCVRGDTSVKISDKLEETLADKERMEQRINSIMHDRGLWRASHTNLEAQNKILAEKLSFYEKKPSGKKNEGEL